MPIFNLLNADAVLLLLVGELPIAVEEWIVRNLWPDLPQFIGVVSLRSPREEGGWHRIHVEESLEGRDETALVFPVASWEAYQASGIVSVAEWCRAAQLRWWCHAPSLIALPGEPPVDLSTIPAQQYGCC